MAALHSVSAAGIVDSLVRDLAAAKGITVSAEELEQMKKSSVRPEAPVDIEALRKAAFG